MKRILAILALIASAVALYAAAVAPTADPVHPGNYTNKELLRYIADYTQDGYVLATAPTANPVHPGNLTEKELLRYIADYTQQGGGTGSGDFLADGSIPMTGALTFSGTTHPGIRLNNLTSTQRDAITPLTGYTIWNTTTGQAEAYSGSAWGALGGGSSSLTSTYVGYGSGANAVTGEAAFTYTAASNTLGVDTIQLGATGVNITNDSDGAITFTGSSAGEDEALTINLDDTANEAVISSSTGITALNTGSIGIKASGAPSELGPLQTSDGKPLLNDLSVYAAGTAYTMTNTSAQVTFGTTSPIKVIDSPGTYLITVRCLVDYSAATVSAETATIKLRRTNNTAADVTGATTTLDLPVATTLTHSYGSVTLPPVLYVTTASDDSLSIFANVSATLGAGSIKISEASIVAVRIR